MLRNPFFGHPRALATLFFTELWERFSYYGMRAILILFMVAPENIGGLAFSVPKAAVIYAIYTGCVYLACLPGGWLADKFLGLQLATLVGGIVIMFGHICLALLSDYGFYGGLTLVAIGTGFLKPNISALVGTLYGDNENKRDAGYSLYYMGINIGAFSAPLLCGWLAQSESFRLVLGENGIDPNSSWHFAFAAAAIGMGFGLTAYVRGSDVLSNYIKRPSLSDFEKRQALQNIVTYGITAIIVSFFVFYLSHVNVLELSTQMVGNAFGFLLLAITASFFYKIFANPDWEQGERKNLYLITILFIAATIFWSLYEQGGSTLNLFAEKSTDNIFLGYQFPSSWFQSLNPIYIICLAPVFAWLWSSIGNESLSNIGKFAIGLLFMGFGWAIMIFAALEVQNGILVSPLWLATMYFLHAIGEMFVSPVGLSAVSKLAPKTMTGLTMGIWFLASSIGSYVGGRVAGLYDAFSIADIFATLTLVAVVSSIGLALITRRFSNSN